MIDQKRADLSGVYKRTLVKKMSSPMEIRNTSAPNGNMSNVNLHKYVISDIDQVNQVPHRQHKKKTRRRLHSTRPYQESLLNMAEARKEIVTALKFHRASMKQQQIQQEQSPLHIASSDVNVNADMSTRNIPMAFYPSDGCSIYPYHIDSFSYESSCDPSLEFALPSQTLGLNLNIKDFGNLSSSCFQGNVCLFASPSSSSSSVAMSSTTTVEEIHSVAEVGLMSQNPEMESGVMKRIKSLGECNDMVLNDTKILGTSPEELEISKDEVLFKEVMEIPSWLNAKDLVITCPEDSSPDPALPWMDIGEIEGMDGEWLD